MRRWTALAAILATGWAAAALGQALPEPTEWTVGGVKRQAIVLKPERATEQPAPLLFVFHGHGGAMRNTARLGYHKAWPEAIVVCPQGLATVTARDPQGSRPGWQNRKGADGDRDLAFFDAMLKSLRAERKVDDRRIYATGHSNGGGFTYLLWAERSDVLAAVAPSSAGAAALLPATGIKPMPALILGGRTDAVVPFAGQGRSMALVRRINQCGAEEKPWPAAGSLEGTLYPSGVGAPLVTLIHPGGHRFPPEAPALIVRFLKEQVKKEPAPPSG
jgi:polyhydroxybutyrate depolymerase